MPRFATVPVIGSQDVKIKRFGPKAREFGRRHPKDDATINLIAGSVRSAKTWAQFAKILQLTEYPVAGHKVITGLSKGAVYRNILTDLYDIVGPRRFHYNKMSGELDLCGSKWHIIGAHDASSEAVIRGMTVGVAVCDELTKMPQAFFQMLVSRMSPAGARLYATTNPDSPYHWIKTDLIDNEDYDKGIGRDLWYEEWTLDDNPNLDPKFRSFVERTYTGVFYQRFILGKWVLAEGAIYRDVLKPEVFYRTSEAPIGLFTPGRHAQRTVSVDYGTANAQVYGDFYDDGHTCWLQNSYYYDSRKEGKQKTDAEYANDMILGYGENWPGFGENQRFWPKVIVDPSAASFKVELQNRGVMVVDANNEVLDGIRKTSTALNRKIVRINEERCPEIKKDLETYAWDENMTKKGKEQPLKEHDHGADCLRYLVHTELSDWRLAA